MSNTYDIDRSGDGIKTIFSTSKKYEEGTIVVFKTIGNITTQVVARELGEKYLELDIAPELNSELKILYAVFNDYQELFKEGKLEDEVIKIKKALADIDYVLENLKEGLDNRVNITTFQAWIRGIERKLGIQIISNGYQTIDNNITL